MGIRRRIAATVFSVLVVAGFVSLPASAAPAAPALNPTPLRTIPDPWFSGHAGLYGWGAATLLDGSVLIGDYWNYRVRHYAKNGTPLADFYNKYGFGVGQTQSPYGLGVDPNSGAVYIADTDQYKIVKVGAGGNFILEWGDQGSGSGKFLYPSRVAVASDGRVFVADTWDNNIVIQSVDDGSGVVTELGQFGVFGTGDGQFKQPHGMSFDYGGPGVADDRLFVVDTNNKRIQVFDALGNFLFKFGAPVPAGGKFTGDLRGLAIDQANDWVYVVDAAGNNVDKYDVNGNYLLSFGKKGTANGQFSDGGREITVDGDGNVWVGDMANFRAQKFSPSGQFLLAVPNPPAPPPLGAFNGPRGVAVDEDGNIFVTDMYNQRIEKFAPDGTFLLAWGSRGRDDYGFNYPRMLATDPRNGAVLVADTDNHRIKKYTNNGVFVWEVGSLGSTPGKFKNPHGVDVGPDGRVYAADSRNCRIQVFDENGSFLYQFGVCGSGTGQLRFPRGVAVDVDSTIWVADSTRDLVLHYTNGGTYLGKVGVKGLADNQLDGPFDIEADGTYVYIADVSAHRIKIWTDPGAVPGDGAFVMAFGTRGTGVGQFIAPTGLDLSPTGTLYIAEQKSERVSEWSL